MMHGVARVGGVRGALAVAMAAGLACAGSPAVSASASADPAAVSVVRGVGGAVEAGLSLSQADRALLARGVAVTEDFRRSERAGVQERSGFVTVKLKTAAQMAAQVSKERALGKAATGAVGTKGVADAQGAGLDAAWAMADEVAARVRHARERLAPSIDESFVEVDEHRVRLPEGWTEEQFASFLLATGDYAWAEPDWRVWPNRVPNDPLFSVQYAHTVNHLNSAVAWDVTTGDPNIITAYCDTGIDVDHPDLLNRVSGFNAVANLAEADGGSITDNEGHGSNVAGCGAARGNNGTGVAGMGWDFKIMPVKVSELADGSASLADLTQGARWAALNGAKTVSVSYGGVDTNTVGSAGTFCRNLGALLAWASGNEGQQTAIIDHPNVTVVGATSTNALLASFSNYGIGMDIVAPGVSVRTTNRTGGYSNATGTSFSTPLINGSLALIWSANPALTAGQVEQLLFDTARDKGAAGRDIFYGWGLANVGAAVQAATGPVSLPLPFVDSFDSAALDGALWPESSGASVSGDADNEPSAPSSLKLTGTGSLTSEGLRAEGAPSPFYSLRFMLQPRGVEAGKSLLVEYTDLFGTWLPLGTVVSDGTDWGVFRQQQFRIPVQGQGPALRVRLTAQGGDASDAWYVDDLRVGNYEGIIPSWLEDFENAPDTSVDFASFGGSISGDADGEPSGSSSALLTGGQSMETQPMDTVALFDVFAFTNYVSYWVQDKGVEAGESLRVEYFNAGGAWALLENVPADGTDGTRMELRQALLPIDAYSGSFRLRFTGTGNAADDRWFVDSVYVGSEQFSQPALCAADLNGDGLADFGDVGAFVNAFAAQDLLADLNGDGLLDFGDVGAFVNAFAAGCP